MATGSDPDELAPAEDAPQVDFEPAEAQPSDDPTRTRRLNVSEPAGTDQDTDQEGDRDAAPDPESRDVPGKMPREKFAALSVMIWSVPGMKDERLKPLAVTGNDPEERQEGALATGRVLYDQLGNWASWLLPPDVDGGGDIAMAAMFLWSQKSIYDAILHEARAKAARDVSPGDESAGEP